ncbi:MAG: DUF2442 domain-containing protein [Bryobacteraceae bacterium]
MLVEIISAEPLDRHQVRLRFDDSSEGIVDIAKLVSWQGVFAPLEDPQYFRQLHVDPDLGTIVWPNGADLDPMVLRSAATGQPISFGPHVSA